MKNILSSVLAVSLLLAGCGPLSDTKSSSTRSDAVTASGAVGVNGLSKSYVGLSGIGLNGIGANGVNASGLSSNSAFGTWFNGNITQGDAVMTYAIACALASGNSTSFTDTNGTVHTWNGAIGLAPTWDTAQMTADEMNWTSACIAAHVTSNGNSVQLSLRGGNTALATTALERSILSTFGGVYFGDLSGTSPTLYACSNSNMNVTNYSLVLQDEGRDCPVTGAPCNPPIAVQDCATVCGTGGSDYAFGPDCTVGGTTYHGVNVYGMLSKYPANIDWTNLLNGASLVNATNAFKGKALSFGKSGSAVATNWNLYAGTYNLVIRYASNGTAYLKLFSGSTQINNPGRTDGLWVFNSTGSTSTWARKTISVTLSALPTLKLQASGNNSLPAPLVDATFMGF